MRRNVVKVVMGLFVMAVFGMAGCGGSGTSSQAPTVSGTASEGALITGKTVKLKDANGKSAVDGTTNATTGIYSIDVTGLTAPFLVTVTGTNGTYVSLAQSAGTANINPITTTVVALAAGNSDVTALLTNPDIKAISANYAAKSALVTTSLQAALPTGIKAEDYFTGTVTAGKGMDAVFDTYKITFNTAGITVKDSSATTVLTIPAATVTANTTQALPTIIIALTSIAVTPASTSIEFSASQQFKATGTYSDSSTKDLTASVTWSSSSTSVATIATSGIVTTVATGSTTITAASGAITGTSALTVIPATKFTPALLATFSGKTATYSYTYNNGTGNPNTGTFTFPATISADGSGTDSSGGTWAINSSGQLVSTKKTSATNTETDTMTLTSGTATTLIGPMVWVNSSNSNTGSGTMTFTVK